jgi:hypothetical protein
MRHPPLRDAAIFQPEELSDSPQPHPRRPAKIQIEEQERRRAYALKSAKAWATRKPSRTRVMLFGSFCATVQFNAPPASTPVHKSIRGLNCLARSTLVSVASA